MDIFQVSGFYHASFTKFLFFSSFPTTLSTIIFPQFKAWITLPAHLSLSEISVDRFILSKLIFSNPSHVLSSLFLLYTFRVFERRMGTAKFANYFLVNLLLSSSLELSFIFISSFFPSSLPDDFIPSGFWGPLFSLFILYFLEIPRISFYSIWGFPITGKSLTYLFGLNLITHSGCTIRLAACGLLSGIIYKIGEKFFSDYQLISSHVASFFYKYFGKLIESKKPNILHKQLGATIEIQRAQSLERLEQMAWGGYYDPNAFQNFANRIPVTTQPSEEQIQLLIDMGFSRQNSIEALRQTNNNTTRAVSILTGVH